MSTPLAIIHGAFGRVVLLHLDHSMVMHAHRDCHVLLKVNGPDVLFGIRGEEYPLTDNTMTLINAWEPHCYRHRHPGEAVTLLTFYFRPDWLRQIDRSFLLSGHPGFFRHPVHLLTPSLERLKHSILRCLGESPWRQKWQVNALMSDFFSEIMATTRLPDDLLPAGLCGEMGFDARIRALIEQLIGSRDIGVTESMETLARAAGLSRAQFFRLFNRSTGMTPATFLNMIRMESCLRSLARPDIPIQAIAKQAGYDTPGNFTRFFVRQQGLSPSHYRKAFAMLK